MAKTRKVSPEEWRAYRRKGRVLLEAAEISLEYELYDAAAVLAIHGSILVADAVLIRTAGVKSASDDHRDVIELLGARVKNPAPAKRHLGMVLSVKNHVEYTGESASSEEATNLVRSAKRLLAWSKEYLPD
jgi:uncharacterized protein (UPF0332 family)